MTHKTLLEMLESENIKEQEFNARLWCWLNDEEYVSHRVGYFGEGLFTTKQTPEDEIPEDYLTSLDACKAVMDEHLQGWFVTCYHKDKWNTELAAEIYKIGDKTYLYSMHTPILPTRNHAEIYAIILAIAHKRGEG